MADKDELESIREITDDTPAPEPDAPEPMRCPACGSPLFQGKCKNEACDNFEA